MLPADPAFIDYYEKIISWTEHMGFDFHTAWSRPGAYLHDGTFDLTGWTLAEYRHIQEVVLCLLSLADPAGKRAADLARGLVPSWTQATLAWAREDGVILAACGISEETLHRWYETVVERLLDPDADTDLPPPLGRHPALSAVPWQACLVALEGKGLMDAWI